MIRMRVLQLSFYGDHNLGLFAKASDKFCILGKFVSERSAERIGETLHVDVEKATIAATDFIGMLCCMNSNGILLPGIATREEVERFESIKRRMGVNLEVLNSKFTALGNLILCNDNGAVISRLLKNEKKIIEDCLGVETEFCSVAGIDVVGSCGIATNKGCLLHRDASEQEIKKIKSILKVDVGIGTANFGSPFVGACGFANSNAAVMGESTTGPEIHRVMESLQFI